MNKYKFFGAINTIINSEDIYHAIDEFVMSDDICRASFMPHFAKVNGATVARIDSIINIEGSISYERHPIYVCLESDYEKVKHLDE